MDPNSDTQDIVDTTATENTGAEVETEQTGQETEQQTETEQSDEEKAQQEAEQEKQKKSRATKRVQDALARAAQAEQKLAEYEAKQNTSTQTQDEPKLEDFEDYNEWQKALRQHDREQIKKEMLAEIGQKESQKSQTQRQAEFEAAMIELESEGVDGGALTKKLETLPPLPIDLHQFGLSAKETLVLAAKLINDDELWLDISQMNPVQAARRIGQEIDKQPNKTAAPKIPNAPKPIKPTSGNAPVKRDYFSQSDDEIMKGL
ncbi:MAG: hypothetical protein RSC68_07695 [Acinetobacter sp.]